MWTDQRGSEILFLPECLLLLATAAKDGSIGRLGVSTQRAPIIQPVNFAYHDRRIVLRLGPGLMADTAGGALVAFEVDHLDRIARVAWSVLVRGLATPLAESERLGATYVAPTPLVPAPGDTVLVVRLDVVTGRRFRLDNATPDAVRWQPAGTSPATKTQTGLRETIATYVPPP
jgi:Pyridoxamine 5'-phosphate oxidase